jgi:hypothetical protein
MEGATITGIKHKNPKACTGLKISEAWPDMSSLDWLHNLDRTKKYQECTEE